MGLAAVASAIGADAVWWNPALIARGPREAAFQLTSKAVLADADASGVVIYPVRGVGAVAISARYLNYGSQEAASNDPSSPTGTFVTYTTMLGATFAAPFGNRFALGFTAKILQYGFSCSGACNTVSGLPQTSALDVGGQYFVTKDSTLSFAAAVRNVGFNLQVHDAPQSDPLPARGEIGVSYSPKIDGMPKEASLHTAADIITRVKDGEGAGYRVGAELAWMNRYQARAGYVVNGPTAASGATFGVGFNTGRLQVDFAQMLSDIGSQGSRPTFVSLRYGF
jgi:hypothetical protein